MIYKIFKHWWPIFLMQIVVNQGALLVGHFFFDPWLQLASFISNIILFIFFWYYETVEQPRIIKEYQQFLRENLLPGASGDWDPSTHFELKFEKDYWL